ncbi:portal protein [uncultured phage cr131_1]|uniref:Portal protein n=1 Tax=uncultured phage cr131_1 TaxID=2772093 RepID=A0A7M1RTX1_9CAUD|nr:portal protein [uncultured phage cr131_1]QOR57726.1 portal protein [uncultured phage cr131_1]
MVRIEDNLYNATFPQQKLPLSKKNEDWQHSCVNYIIGEGNIVSGGRLNTQFGELQTYYNLYNSIFDEKDFKRITNPFKVDDGFPATPLDFNIIRPKIDLLIGEETKRPMNFRVVRTSLEAASDLMDKEKDMLIQYMMSAIMAKMDPEQQLQFQQQLQNGEIMPPEQIAKYMDSTYKDVVENTAYHTLVYLREKLNLDNEFIKGWKDALISGNEVYYIGVLNDEPYMERVNPLYFSYDKSPDLEFIEDGSWCCRKMRLPVAEVYDRYYNKLDEKDLNKLNEMLTGKPMGDMREGDPVDTGGGIQLHIYDNPEFDQKSRYCINVWHCCWKSFKKIFYVTVMDETGTPQVQIADESYKKVGNELSVEPDWIVEVWEGYRAGSDLYFGILPIEYQHVSIDNPNSQKLPYCGCVYSNTNSKPRSLVSILKPLQYMYIVLWYRLELAIARDKGKVVNMDITQIPKSMNITPERWMHYLSSVGVNFINPYEEGWNVPGREGGKPASFNQITALDLTMSNVISEYIQLMDKIEQLAGTISGITEQRQGAISSSELVGNVERSVVQSSHITEPLFWAHAQCKRHVLNMLLNTAKGAWQQTGKKKLSYIFDNGERAFLDIADKFYYEDMDVFVSDTSKDLENIQKLQQLIQPAMQNGASLLEAAEILTNDNFNIIKQKLAAMQKRQEEQAQQQQQAEAQAQQQLQQMQNEAKQQELMLQEAQMDLDRYKIDQDNLTKIAVAQISAYRGTEDKDADDNGVPDVYELGKQAIEQQKVSSDAYNKRYETKQKREIEDAKIELERQKMKHETELLKQKDAEAYRREKLKSETALKNKTNAEAAKNK